ncbi:uncharacterized protein A1O9_01668 [Exophiala aquamarina CBS 119918]|uniref:trans-L-3-hydroxyproline dehydratase n=1 Tax=Exophiala aquamarina CBS 119918 TaxID=1182545 RepID=A0A072Q6X5_9EURO|nr:uncharacterized protein A1O9_01668 [Exophiala aquamarina CBS 119918]KEF63690.1 hypothetical protein A1O9_01668 [Exophiala aquamarina CBS 119918]
MDIAKRLVTPEHRPISCIEMQTTGEPTRIVFEGYPDLSGTLLEQRAEAKAKHDHLRRRLMLEPRGHFDMYGAVLRPETELTKSGEAHVGVLFMTNDGYSTMCGHATIALGRFLLDTHDLNVFPCRNDIKHDPETKTAIVNLHNPSGLLKVTVPVNNDGSASDPSRPVSFISVPSFATGIDVKISLPPARQWRGLEGRSKDIRVDFSYGGAFFCIVSSRELGFSDELKTKDLDQLDKATALLKAHINSDLALSKYFRHPEHDDLGFLYSVIVVDDSRNVPGSEVGLCFFSNQQIDRSPTGGGVAARAALAYAKGDRKLNESWEYHSLVSAAGYGPAFKGTVVEVLAEKYPEIHGPLVRIKGEGYAFYTGFSTYAVETKDPLGDDGFVFKDCQPVTGG